MENKQKKQKNESIVHLKYSNGHEVWVFKRLVNGFRYYGIYKNKIKEDK